jgi:hypothetical protein
MTVDSNRPRASRRIAYGTLARSGGEAVGKVASLIFFVVIARTLGEEQFGDFVFGMSLSTVLLIMAGLGMQEMIGREVAKDPRRADDLVWNVIVLKGLMMVALLVVITGIVTAQGRSLQSAAAIVIVSVGIGFEYQAGTLYAVFDGRERQQYVAATLIVNRTSTALMGIGAAAGENRAAEAARSAVSSPLLEASIEGATGILLNVTGPPDIGLFEVNEAAEVVTSAADQNANVIFGAVIDESHADEVRVTVIATGFGARGRRRRRREETLEAPIPTTAPTGEGFELPREVLDVPSFLRDE